MVSRIISAKHADASLWPAPKSVFISDERRTLLEQLLRERSSLAGICRTVGVESLTWLLHFIVERFAACPEHLHVQLPASPTEVVLRRLESAAEELWSFVQKKAHQPWL